jgi:transcriptional regulator with XRE-family HTH domain
MDLMNKKVENTNVGKNLRLIRKSKGYTLDRLSAISGISKRMISHYETQVKRPSIEKINMLADALGVSIDELMIYGEHTKSSKSDTRLSYKILKKVRVIEELSEREQKAIFQFINTIVEKNKLKKELRSNKEKQFKSS